MELWSDITDITYFYSEVLVGLNYIHNNMFNGVLHPTE